MRLQLDQVLVVRRPDGDVRWSAAGAEDILEHLSPREGDASGWRFRARETGESELRFVDQATPVCPDPPRCPPSPAPPAIPITIAVTR